MHFSVSDRRLLISRQWICKRINEEELVSDENIAVKRRFKSRGQMGDKASAPSRYPEDNQISDEKSAGRGKYREYLLFSSANKACRKTNAPVAALSCSGQPCERRVRFRQQNAGLGFTPVETEPSSLLDSMELRSGIQPGQKGGCRQRKHGSFS